MTGTTVMIIHSGLLPDWTKASISFSRLASFFGLSSDFDSAISWRSRTISVSRLSAISISRIASAPIMAVKVIRAVLILRLEELVLGQELLLL